MGLCQDENRDVGKKEYSEYFDFLSLPDFQKSARPSRGASQTHTGVVTYGRKGRSRVDDLNQTNNVTCPGAFWPKHLQG